MFVFSKGVAANCASALAQMAAASCVQEEKEEKETQEPSDAIAQGSDRKARIHLEPHVRSAHTSRHIPPRCMCDTRHIVYTLMMRPCPTADLSLFYGLILQMLSRSL